jgi:hypothetical protein
LVGIAAFISLLACGSSGGSSFFGTSEPDAKPSPDCSPGGFSDNNNTESFGRFKCAFNQKRPTDSPTAQPVVDRQGSDSTFDFKRPLFVDFTFTKQSGTCQGTAQQYGAGWSAQADPRDPHMLKLSGQGQAPDLAGPIDAKGNFTASGTRELAPGLNFDQKITGQLKVGVDGNGTATVTSTTGLRVQGQSCTDTHQGNGQVKPAQP